MNNLREIIQSAQVARHDPRLQVEENACRFRAITHRPNWVGNQTTLTPEPLTGWMSGPEMVKWLKSAGQP